MGTFDQRTQLFYYIRYRGLRQLDFALQVEDLQLKFIGRRHLPRLPWNKDRHRNLPDIWADFCVYLTYLHAVEK